MSIDSFAAEANLAVRNAQTQDMIRRKLEIDALRERLSPGQDPKEKLREACQGFETIFIQKMWDQMRQNVPKEGYLHSKQESMYQSMYDHEFSKKMAEAGGIGLADMLYEQLSRTMAESSRTASPGVNPRLPIIPASSSPSNIKFANPDQSYAPQIKPLYEEYDESAALAAERFTLPEQRGLPLQRHPAALKNADLLTLDEIDFEAASQDLLRRELEASRADGGPEPAAAPAGRPAGGASSWGAPQVSLNAPAGRQAARRRPVRPEEQAGPAASAPAVAEGRYPQTGPAGLTPEEQRLLSAALAENRKLAGDGPL